MVVEFCCQADPGIITANPVPACPGQLVNWMGSGYQTDPDYAQIFFITDATGEIVEIFDADSGP